MLININYSHNVRVLPKFVRTFVASNIFLKSLYELRQEIDLVQYDDMMFVILDPFNRTTLLYISEREFVTVMNSCLSNGIRLIIVARPGELEKLSKEQESSALKPSDSKPEGTTPLNISILSSNSGTGHSQEFTLLDITKYKVRNFLSGNYYLLNRCSIARPRYYSSKSILQKVKVTSVLAIAANVARIGASKELGGNIVMFSLKDSKEFLKAVKLVIAKIIAITTNTARVLPRVRRVYKLLDMAILFNKNNGPTATVNWLKGCQLALMRKVAKSDYRSLRDLYPNLPLPRLINGLPPIIGTKDRKAIRDGNVKTIRLWLTIFGVFRIIDSPFQQKLNTITDGPLINERSRSEFREFLNYDFLCILEYSRLPCEITLQPTKDLVCSRAAGPNNKVACHSFLTDALLYFTGVLDYQWIVRWTTLTGDFFVLDQLNLAWEIVRQLTNSCANNWIKTKKSVPSHMIRGGQLAFKEEAAGKLRIFAIADIWTQSLLSSLHDALFSFLKKLPNDGTFDQDLAVKRSQVKAATQEVYSLDLSSATDRLPIALQKDLLDLLIKPGIGPLWADILTDRDYYIPKNKYNLTGSVRYRCGQPMGCLSSWAMLALTHHVIIQMCAFKVHRTWKWNTEYEILGDDIVIFNKNLALEYIRYMKEIGVSISLPKSLESKNSVFEFAKRFCNSIYDLSPLSWREMINGQSISGRINLLLRLAKMNRIETTHHISTVLGRFDQKLDSSFLTNVLGTLALSKLYQKSKVTLELVVDTLINPKGLKPKGAGYPVNQVLTIVLNVLLGKEYTLSQGNVRAALRNKGGYDVILKRDILERCKQLIEAYRAEKQFEELTTACLSLVRKGTDIPNSLIGHFGQLLKAYMPFSVYFDDEGSSRAIELFGTMSAEEMQRALLPPLDLMELRQQELLASVNSIPIVDCLTLEEDLKIYIQEHSVAPARQIKKDKLFFIDSMVDKWITYDRTVKAFTAMLSGKKRKPKTAVEGSPFPFFSMTKKDGTSIVNHEFKPWMQKTPKD
jgi:hypothetical protein